MGQCPRERGMTSVVKALNFPSSKRMVDLRPPSLLGLSSHLRSNNLVGEEELSAGVVVPLAQTGDETSAKRLLAGRGQSNVAGDPTRRHCPHLPLAKPASRAPIYTGPIARGHATTARADRANGCSSGSPRMTGGAAWPTVRMNPSGARSMTPANPRLRLSRR